MREYVMRESQPEPLNRLIEKFHNLVSQGPVYVCTCCDQL